MKYPAQTDIAVLMLFFNRPDSLRVVFEQVRKARPTRLFLFQDGPRNKKDLPAIMACREVVAEIDWDCDVHRNYQEQNLDMAKFYIARYLRELTEHARTEYPG